MNELWDRVEEGMKERGISQSELSRRAKIRPNTLSNWKSGQTLNPRKNDIDAVGRVINRTAAYLLTGIGPKVRDDMVAEPYRNLPTQADLERMAEVVELIQDAFLQKKKRLPPKIMGTLCAEGYLEALRNPDLKGAALVEQLRSIINVAMASAG